MEIIKQLRNLNSDKRAVTALEYGMIAALIAVVAVSGFSAVGTNLNKTLTNISTSLPDGKLPTAPTTP
jgi:pilus assembly protein Flp/PilA